MSALPSEPVQPRLVSTLRRLLAQSLVAAECRLELAGIDLEIERDRIGSQLLRYGVAVLLGFLSLQLALLLLFVLAWNTPWCYPVIGSALVASLLGAAIAVRGALRLRRSPIFASSIDELAVDVRGVRPVRP